MKLCGLIYRESSEEAKQFAGQAIRMLKERGYEARLLQSQEPIVGAERAPDDKWFEGLELVVVVGGDGTLLRAAQLVSSSKVPVVGVKLGGLGFLTEVQPEELTTVLDQIVEGKENATERMMLEARLKDEREEVRFVALNEISITSTGLPKVIDLDADINGVFVSSFTADGLLVSTPTGSTAYCMAAGGPISHPRVRAMTITPVCPHTLTSRPLVIPDDSKITITMPKDIDYVRITADSQKEWPLRMDQRLEITTRDRGILLVGSPSMTYYEILRTKLRWGER